VCEDEGTMVLQNIGNYLLSVMVSYGTRMEFSSTPLFKPQNCIFCYPFGAITFMNRSSKCCL